MGKTTTLHVHHAFWYISWLGDEFWSIFLHNLLIADGDLSLSNDDVNENDKKAIGLDGQNNNSARASRFFVYFLAVSARLRRENT